MSKGYIQFRKICESPEFYIFKGYTIETEFGFGGSPVAEPSIDLSTVEIRLVDRGPMDKYVIEADDYSITVDNKRRSVKLTYGGQTSRLQKAEMVGADDD